MTDRLRAKPPTTDTESWTRCTVRQVTTDDGGVRVRVDSPAGDSVDLQLSKAQFELFTGRIEEPGEGPSGAIDTTAWYK